jgi:hypothetical protein
MFCHLKGFKHFKVELAAQKKPPEGGFFVPVR